MDVPAGILTMLWDLVSEIAWLPGILIGGYLVLSIVLALRKGSGS